MIKKIFNSRIYKVFLAVVFFALIIFIVPSENFNFVRGFFSKITRPFQKFSYSLSYSFIEAKNFISSIGDLKKENEKLIEENQILMAENVLSLDIKKENDYLREQLRILPRKNLDLVPAFVIGRDQEGFGNWIVIDKGKKDKIEKGDPIIISGGILVGIVEDVFDDSSRIILITNPKSSISAVIAETETSGIAKGEFGLGISLDMVLQTDILKIGDEVITSGTGKLERGFLLGRVQNIYSSDDKLFQKATVLPAINFSKLRIVFVVK